MVPWTGQTPADTLTSIGRVGVGWLAGLNVNWPPWIANLANLAQLVALAAAVITIAFTRHRLAGHVDMGRPPGHDTRQSRWRDGGRPLEARVDKASDLVESILEKKGWTHARLVLELRRTARSLGQPEPTGLDVVTVNRWRRGRQNASHYYLHLLRRLELEVRRTSADQEGRITAYCGQPGLCGVDFDPVRRRRFLACAAALTGAAIIDPELLDHALTAGRDVDSKLVNALELLTLDWARRWHNAQPSALLCGVRSQMSVLNELSLSPGVQSRGAQRVASRTAALAGWLTWLTGDRATAGAFYALASGIAAEVGDDATVGFVLVARSFLYSRLFGASPLVQQQPLALLDQAVTVVGHAGAPMLSVFALVRRAEERAVVTSGGRPTAIMDDLDRAERALAGVSEPDTGFFAYLDVQRLAGVRGTCAALLGESGEAVKILSGVIATTAPALAAERSVLMTDLAAAYAQAAEVDEACRLLRQSLEVGRRGDANRVARVLDVRRTHLERWPDSRPVRDLDEVLRSQHLV